MTKTNQKSIFDAKQVRKSFKSRFCGEFMLPSGKPSGYYKFPITEDEINAFMEQYQDEQKPNGFLTWSEWALWSTLRHKYGINYLKPKKQQFLSHIDAFYAEPKEDNLEERLLNYCDFRLEQICELACRKLSSPEPEPNTEKNEKNFRSSLDNDDLDVLY